jgi:hypothetical protein
MAGRRTGPCDRHDSKSPPSWDGDEASRGVVATGAVGSRYVGWLRLFRYEVRCGRDGVIPDLVEAVGEPGRLTSDPRVARRLLDLVAAVPRVSGRDALKAGERAAPAGHEEGVGPEVRAT